jgi:hypothetical protein
MPATHFNNVADLLPGAPPEQDGAGKTACVLVAQIYSDTRFYADTIRDPFPRSRSSGPWL